MRSCPEAANHSRYLAWDMKVVIMMIFMMMMIWDMQVIMFLIFMITLQCFDNVKNDKS